jgi:hypothetical protein
MYYDRGNRFNLVINTRIEANIAVTGGGVYWNTNYGIYNSLSNYLSNFLSNSISNFLSYYISNTSI